MSIYMRLKNSTSREECDDSSNFFLQGRSALLMKISLYCSTISLVHLAGILWVQYIFLDTTVLPIQIEEFHLLRTHLVQEPSTAFQLLRTCVLQEPSAARAKT